MKYPTCQPVIDLHQIGTGEPLPSQDPVPGRTRSPVASAHFSAADDAASSVTGGGLGGPPAGDCVAAAYVRERMASQADARDILKGLVNGYGATLTYPTYRTALRVGDIKTEAASWCALHTARLLLDSFLNKASRR